jgi:hypothetical protein
MNRSYTLASDVRVRHDAVIDKLIGGGIMALFIPASMAGAIAELVLAGEELLGGVWVGSGRSGGCR